MMQWLYRHGPRLSRWTGTRVRPQPGMLSRWSSGDLDLSVARNACPAPHV